MIFDKNYDKILWLILKGNKDNRERILEFIGSIPNHFLIKIQNTIKEYEEYKLDNNNLVKKNFNGEWFDGEKYLYHFNIDKDSDTLFVGRNIFKYGIVNNDFGLLLTNDIDFKIIDNFCEYLIGKVSYDYELINDGSKVIQGEYTSVDYKLLNVIFGNVIVTSNKNRIFFKDRMNFVDTDKIPDDYNLDNIKKLFRGKK